MAYFCGWNEEKTADLEGYTIFFIIFKNRVPRGTIKRDRMARDNYFKSEEARAREMAHWFGQPGGNKPKDIRIARTMREFYAWCENVASLDELKEYAKDETKPAARRRFVKALMDCDKVQDFFDLTNQTHGHPQIQIEVADVPKIDIEIIGGENNETK